MYGLECFHDNIYIYVSYIKAQKVLNCRNAPTTTVVVGIDHIETFNTLIILVDIFLYFHFFITEMGI